MSEFKDVTVVKKANVYFDGICPDTALAGYIMVSGGKIVRCSRR